MLQRFTLRLVLTLLIGAVIFFVLSSDKKKQTHSLMNDAFLDVLPVSEDGAVGLKIIKQDYFLSFISRSQKTEKNIPLHFEYQEHQKAPQLIIVNDQAFLTHATVVLAIDIAKQQKSWEVVFDKKFLSPENTLTHYLFNQKYWLRLSIRDNQQIISFYNLSDGQLLWEKALSAGDLVKQISIHHDKIIYDTNYMKLVYLNQKDGQEILRHDIWGEYFYDNDFLYYFSDSQFHRRDFVQLKEQSLEESVLQDTQNINDATFVPSYSLLVFFDAFSSKQKNYDTAVFTKGVSSFELVKFNFANKTKEWVFDFSDWEPFEMTAAKTFLPQKKSEMLYQIFLLQNGLETKKNYKLVALDLLKNKLAWEIKDLPVTMPLAFFKKDKIYYLQSGSLLMSVSEETGQIIAAIEFPDFVHSVQMTPQHFYQNSLLIFNHHNWCYLDRITLQLQTCLVNGVAIQDVKESLKSSLQNFE